MEEPRLSVAAAARKLGIAPATLRTWDRRYGIGPTDHTPGRHRRYSSEDVARLELMRHALVRGATPSEAARYARTVDPDAFDQDRPARPAQPAPGGAGTAPLLRERPPAAVADVSGQAASPGDRVRVGSRMLRLPGAGGRARGLGRAALALDAAALRHVLAESVATSGVEVTWEDVARPVLAAVGERWADTGAGVEIEHLLSECVAAVFGQHVAVVADADHRPVLLAGMPGEQHTLPMIVLAAVLADRGVACRALGANLPFEGLVAAVRRIAPSAVVLWAQLRMSADVEVLRVLPRTRPAFRTFVAGPGWADLRLPPPVDRLDTLASAGTRISAAVLA